MLVRGYLVNEFDEKVGSYNINGRNEYYVSMYHQNRGMMNERQLVDYAEQMGLYLEESRIVLNKVGKMYGQF